MGFGCLVWFVFFFIQTATSSWKVVSSSCLQGVTDDGLNEALPLVPQSLAVMVTYALSVIKICMQAGRLVKVKKGTCYRSSEWP